MRAVAWFWHKNHASRRTYDGGPRTHRARSSLLVPLVRDAFVMIGLMLCDRPTRGTSSRASSSRTHRCRCADWQIIIGSSLALLVIVTLLAVLLMGAPRLG